MYVIGFGIFTFLKPDQVKLEFNVALNTVEIIVQEYQTKLDALDWRNNYLRVVCFASHAFIWSFFLCLFEHAQFELTNILQVIPIVSSGLEEVGN
jgi:hypothetical protein